ncbi:MAG: hypothetical protein KC442_25660 [Thermomicrobiales bacterium]|nr:hypothetical protein [Thermomicrobiales bacterium]
MRVPGKLIATATVATALTFGLIGAGRAQDATPMAGMDAAPGYHNHLHLGTCDDLDSQPAYVLADLVFPAWVSELTGESTSAEGAVPDVASFGGAPIPVATATTEVDVALTDLISGGHGLNVHDAVDPSIYIACGNVGGVPDENGNLFIGLAEQNDSGYSGTAWFHDNGGSTTVTVFLNHNAAQDEITAELTSLQAAAATPEDSAEAAATEGPGATPVAALEGTPVTT